MQSRRVDGASLVGAPPNSSLVAIGNFDGVHRGHQQVICAAAAEAEQRGLAPLVLTFHPHPAAVLKKDVALEVLTPIERKVELMTRIDPRLRVVVEEFTPALASMAPEQFAEKLLVEQLGAAVVIVGDNFRFGQGRSGDLGALQELGTRLGFEARANPLVGDETGPFSSSRARAALAVGDLVTVEAILGRPHALSGTVVAADGRGRTIGVPTANLSEVVEALPPHGVYACLVDQLSAEGGAQRLAKGVANIGVRPTVDAGFSVEAHLLDFDADLYGARLRLHLVSRLRDEQQFSGLDELKAQIERDIAASRAALAGRSPDPAAGGSWY